MNMENKSVVPIRTNTYLRTQLYIHILRISKCESCSFVRTQTTKVRADAFVEVLFEEHQQLLFHRREEIGNR